MQAFLSIADEVVKQRYSDVRAMILSSCDVLRAGFCMVHVISGAAQHVPSQETKPKKEAELPARALALDTAGCSIGAFCADVSRC